jgi:TM2 domain-containing membrane protein YozV
MNDETTKVTDPGEGQMNVPPPPGETGWTQGPASYGAGYGTVPPQGPAAPQQTSPALAGLLGFIPGVGAIYNGQYAKGVVHLVIFAVLVSFCSHVSGIFGLFVAGWLFYMAFEAYHTAIARRDGLPLPNAFGFNDIGERMGFGKNWPVHPASGGTGPASSTTQWTPAPPTASSAPPPPAAAWTAAQQGPESSRANWLGYVPPTAFGGGVAGAPYSAPPQGGATSAGGPVPYAETYTGTGAVPPAGVTGRRFPVGALWLIGLGTLFLCGQWIPYWRINGLWVAAIILAAISISSFVRRLGYLGGVAYPGNLICAVRGPIMLMVLAVLLALQASDVVRVAKTWPVLFIALGATLLLERTAGSISVQDDEAGKGGQ